MNFIYQIANSRVEPPKLGRVIVSFLFFTNMLVRSKHNFPLHEATYSFTNVIIEIMIFSPK